MNKSLCFFSVFWFCSLLVQAQYYENGQDPFSIKWNKIETDHFQIIFSEDIDSIGNQLAGYFEAIYTSGGNTLVHNTRKIPVIVHNQNVFSNGEVAWAPKRMNLYITPPQAGYIVPYNWSLALHEFRHVVQIDKLNQSSTQLLYYIFGEQAIGAVLGWHIPLWFLEGDAVVYETGASKGGRGRIPDFTMKLNAQVAEQGIYSYPKAQFGSYKDFVPNHYELGYQLVSRSRLKYGTAVWEKTLNQVARSPIHPNAFSKGIKKVTGLPERKLYSELMNELKSELNIETLDKKQGNAYINYFSPYKIGSNTISYKTSYRDIPRIVVTDTLGNDKIIQSSGSIFNQTFSYNDSVLVWNEHKGTRWENNNYNRIVLFNLRTNKKSYLAKKGRVFHSRISPDNKKILSTEVSTQLNWSITIRDAFTGEIIDSIGFDKVQPVQPSWSPNMEEIVFMQLGFNGKSLGVLNLETHKINWIIHDEFLDMSYPMHLGNAILMKGVYKGVSNILRYDFETKKWTAITDAKYGVGEGRFTDKEYIFTDYTSDGYKLKRSDLNDLKIIRIEKPEKFETELTQNILSEEQTIEFATIDTSFQIENYSRLKHLFNVHSWAPLGINIQNIEVGPGATVLSQNALSTSAFSGGYQYNISEKSHRYFADYSYKGFYPLLNTTFSKTYFQEYMEGEGDTLHFVKYSDVSLYVGATIPFNFDRGKWFRRFNIQMAYEYRSITPSPDNTMQLTSPKISSIYAQLYFYNLLTTSHRDLQSRWGQILSLNYMTSPFNWEQMGQLASAEMWLYFPGIVKNHGLKLYGGYQVKEYGEYGFSDRLSYPTGYHYYNNTQMISGNANYLFPILYPDLNMWEYVYIKRIKANIFYQYSAFEYKSNQFDIASVGADLTANMHLFRFVFPFEIGVRYARKFDYNDNFYQFLFNVNF